MKWVFDQHIFSVSSRLSGPMLLHPLKLDEVGLFCLSFVIFVLPGVFHILRLHGIVGLFGWRVDFSGLPDVGLFGWLGHLFFLDLLDFWMVL